LKTSVFNIGSHAGYAAFSIASKFTENHIIFSNLHPH